MTIRTTLDDVKNKASDAAHKLGDAATEAAHKVGDAATRAAHSVEDAAAHASTSVKAKAHELKASADAHLGSAKASARESLSSAEDKARQAQRSAHVETRTVGEKASDALDSAALDIQAEGDKARAEALRTQDSHPARSAALSGVANAADAVAGDRAKKARDQDSLL